MEKFSGWNDQTTGVNPFVQPPRASPDHVLWQLVTVPLSWLLLLLRVPCTVVLGLVICFTSALTTIIPLPWLDRVLRFALEVPSARVALTMFGFYSPVEATLPRTMTHLEPSPTLVARQKTDKALPGVEVYVVNQQSYIDVLWLASRYAPTFARVSAEGGLTRLSTLQALGMATGTIAPGAAAEGAEASTLHTLQWARSTFAGPLVLFPEGAPTNGKGVLEFCQSALDAARAVLRSPPASAPHIRLLGIKYGVTPTCQPQFVAGNCWVHALHLMSHALNTMTITSLPLGLDPQPADFLPAGEGGDQPTLHAAAAADWAVATHTALAEVVRGGVKPVALDAQDHVKFVAFLGGDAAAQKLKKVL